MSVLNLTTDNFEEATGKGKVLVDFWAAWCNPCRMVAPVIEQLAEEFNGTVTVAKVDIDSESALAARFDVMSIPTVLILKDGVEVKRIVGAEPKETYVAELNAC